MTTPIISFAGNPLLRASSERADSVWLDARRADSTARAVTFWGDRPAIDLQATGPHRPAWRPFSEIDRDLPVHEIVFLGLDGDGAARFAVGHWPSAEMEPPETLGKIIDLRSITPDLAPDDAAILAQAKALLAWHATHRHCARCGAMTTPVDGGYRRRCGACGGDHFPRTDPVIIVLVVRGDQCLLGRGVNFPPDRYSALAGFMEPGETIEEAAAREVAEEVGIRLGAIRYVASQPWPWPMSLMIGLIAEAETTEITLDPTEIADARWIDRETVITALKGAEDLGFSLPPPLAIARQLVRVWLGHDGP